MEWNRSTGKFRKNNLSTQISGDGTHLKTDEIHPKTKKSYSEGLSNRRHYRPDLALLQLIS